ncbi:MAG TPA: AAA family ATPase [Polyangiaceae bacterium]|nr:AAA family ATPase [Polyangiaceae bacterium]
MARFIHKARGDALRVAGRYRILKALASGGMGTVFAALDESTGERVALKRLGVSPREGVTRRKGPPDTDVALRFQLEYAMLSRLRHPCIIDVHEYGIDKGLPYYTMELLDGQDLRETAKAPYRDACRHARDVASSLALLHAHRLVHRDVSPRNVRVTAFGRAKLFDFGTLTPFGVPPDIAGTPSCVPPEALNGSSLDHRADLFSLGSVLYWLLTAREAFPARCLDDLPALLEKEPTPPSAFTECPEELDALVMAMLHRDPLARPSSAAEVIERLDAIAKLPPEPQNDVAYSYVVSAKTVGRAAETTLLAQAIDRTLRRQGGGLLVTAERGLGKTRLAREAAVMGQLRGATVLFVDAAARRRPYETAALVGRRLLQASPLDAALAAVPHARHVAHVVPELVERRSAAPFDERGVEGQDEIHDALVAWFSEFTERRPLVLVVDDVDAADDGSARFIAALAREAWGRRLLVIATSREERPANMPHGAFASVLRLAPLRGDAVAELVHSLFGDAPHLRRFAASLHEKSAGSPACCMELVTDLVERKVVRYAGGAWLLPEASLVDALSASLEEASAARLSRLRPAARSLAEALSVASAALPLSLCLWLVHDDTGRAPRAAMLLLDELVSEGVLVGAAGEYRFADEALRRVLHAQVSAERRGRLHRKLGEAFVRSSRGTAFDYINAGFHLLLGGDEDRGAELLSCAGRRLILESRDLRAAVPALEAALAVYRKRGRPSHELSFLVGPLASAAHGVDYRLAFRYGAEALRLFRGAVGLEQAAELAKRKERPRAVAEAVAMAAADRRLGAGDAEQVSTRELFEMFFCCTISLSTVFAVCLEDAGLADVQASLEPLAHLGDGHPAPWVYRYTVAVRKMSAGSYAEAEEELRAVVRAFEDDGPTRLPAKSLSLLLGGSFFALGVMALLRVSEDVLEYADRLAALGGGIFEMIADQLRMMHHAYRGEVGRARRYRDRIDARAISRGSAWQLEVWEAPAMLLVYVRENDVMGLKLTSGRLDRLAAELPAYRRLAVVARAAHLRVRGELRAARVLLEGVLLNGAPRFAGRSMATGLLAEIYNSEGEFARAERITRPFAAMGDGRFSRATLAARIQHAHALAGLGGFEAARAELDAALREHANTGDPVARGLLHRACAQLALLEGEPASFEAHVTAMETLFRPTENPALISMCERLRHELRRGKTARSGEYSMRPEEIDPQRRSSGE